MSAVRCWRAHGAGLLGLALVPWLASCGEPVEICTSELDVELAPPDGALDVVVVACLDGAARRSDQGRIEVDLDVRPNGTPQAPLAVTFDLGGEPVGVDLDDRPPWFMRSEELVEGPGCGRIPLRIQQLVADPGLALSVSVDASFEKSSKSTCRVEIEPR